jgi:hypothetical protein
VFRLLVIYIYKHTRFVFFRSNLLTLYLLHEIEYGVESVYVFRRINCMYVKFH